MEVVWKQYLYRIVKSVKQFDRSSDIQITQRVLFRISFLSLFFLNIPKVTAIENSQNQRCESIYSQLESAREIPSYLSNKLRMRRFFTDDEVTKYPVDLQPILSEINKIESEGSASIERIQQGNRFMKDHKAIDKFISYLPTISKMDSVYLFLKFSFLDVRMNESQFAAFQNKLISEVNWNELTYTDLSQLLAELDFQAFNLAKSDSTKKYIERYQKIFDQRLFSILYKVWIEEFVMLSKRFPKDPSKRIVKDTISVFGVISRYNFRLLQTDEIRIAISEVVSTLLTHGKDKDIHYLVEALMVSGFQITGRSRDILVMRLLELAKNPKPFIASKAIMSLLSYYRIASSFHSDKEENYKMINKIHDIAFRYHEQNKTHIGIVAGILRFLMHLHPTSLKSYWARYQEILSKYTDEELSHYPSLISVNLYYTKVLKFSDEPLYRPTVKFKTDERTMTVGYQQRLLHDFLKKQVLKLHPEIRNLPASAQETHLNSLLTMEYEIPNTEYVVDFYVRDENLIIEYNGPDHYSHSVKKNYVTGKAEVVDKLNLQSKRRSEILQALGFKVEIIKYDQLNDIIKDP